MQFWNSLKNRIRLAAARERPDPGGGDAARERPDAVVGDDASDVHEKANALNNGVDAGSIDAAPFGSADVSKADVSDQNGDNFPLRLIPAPLSPPSSFERRLSPSESSGTPPSVASTLQSTRYSKSHLTSFSSSISSSDSTGASYSSGYGSNSPSSFNSYSSYSSNSFNSNKSDCRSSINHSNTSTFKTTNPNQLSSIVGSNSPTSSCSSSSSFSTFSPLVSSSSSSSSIPLPLPTTSSKMSTISSTSPSSLAHPMKPLVSDFEATPSSTASSADSKVVRYIEFPGMGRRDRATLNSSDSSNVEESLQSQQGSPYDRDHPSSTFRARPISVGLSATSAELRPIKNEIDVDSSNSPANRDLAFPLTPVSAPEPPQADAATLPSVLGVKPRKKRRRISRTQRRLKKWRREREAGSHVMEESPISYDWMPDAVLERILAHVPMRDRSRAALVSTSWADTIALCPRVWPTLRLTPDDFVRSKFNLYRRSSRGPATDRLYRCLQSVGHFYRHIIVDPNPEMHVLFEHLRVIKEYVESHVWEFNHSTAFPRLRTFEYTHTPVKVRADAVTSRSRRRQAYGNLVGLEDEGTFETVRVIVNGVRRLQRLVLKNLFIGEVEPLRKIVDAVIVGKNDFIRYLDVTNLTKTPIESLYFPVFVNLKTLVLTTNFLTETLLAEIAVSSVVDLVLDHDEYTSPFQNSLAEEAWTSFKETNPNIRVTLLSTSGRQDVIHQDQAPVTCIIYKSERVGLDSMGLMSHVHDYCDTLEILAQEGLVKYRVAKSFHDRVDMNLVMLVRSSSRLHTLALRERVSTATLLVLASSTKTLKKFYVRRNAVIKRSDWASRRNVHAVARSYEETEREIGRCLGDPTWRMLSDREYKSLRFHWSDGGGESLGESRSDREKRRSE